MVSQVAPTISTSVVTPTPVNVTVGNRKIDTSVVPYMRHVPIIIQTRNLMPFANANVWIDDVKVNQFTQPSSYIQANNGIGKVMLRGEGIYSNTTHAYAQLMEFSEQGQVLYIDENYLVMNLLPYGPINSNNFTKQTYSVGDIVYQTPDNSANIQIASMIGQVAYWANQDGALAITIDSGFVANGAGNLILRKSGSTFLSNVQNIVAGEKFQVGTVVTSTDNVNAKFSINAWDSYHGIVPIATGNANTIHLNGRVN